MRKSEADIAPHLHLVYLEKVKKSLVRWDLILSGSFHVEISCSMDSFQAGRQSGKTTILFFAWSS